MAQTIKMVCIVDGVEQTVGRCHPGQARLLRKTGMGEWKDGKVFLQEVRTQLPEKPVLGGMNLLSHRLETLGGFVSEEPTNWRKDAAFTKGYDYEEIKNLLREHPEGGSTVEDLNQGNIFLDRTHVSEPEERKSETLGEWILESRRRRELGHVLYICDDPRRLAMGFVDDEESVAYFLGVRKIKEATEVGLRELGVSRADLLTHEGRQRILCGKTIDWYAPGEGPLLNEGIEELTNIWLQEAQEEITGYEEKDLENLVETFNALNLEEVPRPTSPKGSVDPDPTS